jgi:hypothetical protein
MLSDPQSFAVTSTNFISSPGNLSLPAISRLDQASRYEKSDLAQDPAAQTFGLSVSHTISNKGRKRSVVRVDVAGLVANAIVGTGSLPSSGSVYLVFDRPIEQQDGLSHDDYVDIVTGLVTWLSASSYAKTQSVLNGES